MNRFQRLVLELGHGATDAATMSQVAAFAHLLETELLALFVEDETLLHASGYPFTREINPLSMRWRELAPDQVEADFRAEADRVRRRLAVAARASGVSHQFEIRRGDLSLHVAEICVATDILVVSAPRRAATGATLGFRSLREVAHQSAASVLFLPSNTVRPHGPIVAVVSGAHDPTLALAERIAAYAREPLVVLSPDEAGSIAAVLGNTRERMIVLTRDTLLDGAELAAERGVPVLVVEPV